MSIAFNLKDLPDQICQQLSKELSFQPIKAVPKYVKFPKLEPPIHFFLVDKSTGIVRFPLKHVTNLLDIPMNNRDFPECKVEFWGRPRDYQLEILQEAYQQFEEHGTTILGVPPGYGKTFMSLGLWSSRQHPGVILLQSLALIQQWVTTVQKFMKNVNVWIVGEEDVPDDMPDLIICMNERYQRIPERFRQNIGTMIIDEAHLHCTRGNVEALLFFEPSHIIACSATLERNDEMHKMIYAMTGEHGVFHISTQPYTVLRIKTGLEFMMPIEKRGPNYDQFLKDVCESKERNQIIHSFIRKAVNNDHKVILLSKRVEHCDVLSNMADTDKIKCGRLYGQKKNYQDCPVLYGTFPKIGTGFDEATYCDDFNGKYSDILIFSNTVKSWQSFEQSRGRVMRTSNPIIVWFDDDNSTSRRHFEGLMPWIEKTNGTIQEMMYHNDEFILIEKMN